MRQFIKRYWRRLLIVITAVIVAVIGLFFFLPDGIPPAPESDNRPSQVQAGPTPTPIRFVNLVIAVQELPRGFRIPQNAVAVRPWPEESAPFNGITDIDQVVGKIARTDIFREQPILSNMLVDDYNNLATRLGQVGSDTAAILPENLVAITLYVPPTELPRDLANGDRVDLLHSVPVQDALSKQSGAPGYVTQRTVQDALVVFIGDVPITPFAFATPTPTAEVGGGPFSLFRPAPPPVPRQAQNPTAPIYADDAEWVPLTLGVTPQDASLVAWARNNQVRVTVVLRSATDTSQITSESVDVDSFAREYRFDLPFVTPFTDTPVPTPNYTATLDALQFQAEATSIARTFAPPSQIPDGTPPPSATPGAIGGKRQADIAATSTELAEMFAGRTQTAPARDALTPDAP